MKFVYGADGMINVKTGAILNFSFGLSGWFDKKWSEIVTTVDGWMKDIANGYYEFIGWSFSELTKMVTTVPIGMIDNENVFKLQGLFMGYSVLMMIFLSVIEGYKAIMGVSYTKITTIFGRTFVALVGAGLTVPAVIWLVNCANLAVQMIMLLATSYFGSGGNVGEVLKDFSAGGFGNFFASLLFMVAFFYFIAHALFKVGIRWFDLLMNVVSSPFAWGAYVTNGTAGYLKRWMTTTGRLILTNIVYAFYVVVISVIILSPAGVDSAGGWLGRMLLLIGGLFRLANPPAWLQAMDVQGSAGPALKKIWSKIPRRIAISNKQG